MKIKRNILFVSIVAVALLVLSGCSSIKAPMTQGKLTEKFLDTTESVLKVQRIATAKANNHGKDSYKFTAVFDKKAKVEGDKVQKTLSTLEGSDKFKGYPTEVYNYSKSALAYIKAVESDTSRKIVDKKYHQATQDAMKVAGETKSKKVKDYVTTLVSNDSVMQAKALEQKKKEAKNEYNKQIHLYNNPLSALKDHAKSKINITYGWGSVLIIVSILLITSVFLQPNRSEDNSDALTNEALKPKPRGFDLLMLRSTEGLIVIMVLVMILMNQK